MRKVYFFASSVAALGAIMYLKSAPVEVRTGAWSPSGIMSEARAGAAAVRLSDGRVLITGGTGPNGVLATAELLGPTGSFSRAASMNHGRSNHISVALEDGRVLVAGGRVQGEAAFNSAEVYDPKTNRWADAGAMDASRVGHTATLLSDGRVLIAGGQAGDVTHASLEIFDAGSSKFDTVPVQLSSPRTRHAAALLPDGRVLLAGGFSGTETLRSTEIFNPRDGTVSRGPDLLGPREAFTATSLLDGKVLIAGGSFGSADLASAEIFDPETATFSATGAMTAARHGHLAFLLPNNNRVLLVGGDAAASSAELFTPWRSSFQPTGSLGDTRLDAAGAPVGRHGTLVLAGGRNRALQLDSSRLYRFATVRTDREEYSRDEPVTITGSGWQPGEKVTMTVKAFPKTGEDRTLTAQADSSGNISSSDFQPDPGGGPTTMYVLTAVGSTSEGQLRFASSSANLDQCANGTASAPAFCTAGADWVNGNLGASKAHYFEGDSVPYRMRLGGLTPGKAGNTLTIEWDTTQSGKHALDYLTSFNRTITTADPCAGVSGCASPSTFPIPADPNVTGAGVTPVPGSFTMYNGTITSVSAYSISGTFAGNSSTRITITFTSTTSSPTLAWGGHIASRSDWGANNAAVNITGSPFHMRLIELNGGGGNQDRSLSNDAVTFPGSITIIKIVDAAYPQNNLFSYTSSFADLGSFTLAGTSAGSSRVVTSISAFATYTVTESIPAGWQIDPSSGCTDPNNNSSINAATGIATISLEEGDNVVCTFKNLLKPATLLVKKHVSTTNGGTTQAGAFTLHVKIGGSDVAGSPAPGSETGTTYTLSVFSLSGTTYSVSENALPAGYSFGGFTGTCDSSGNVTLLAGGTTATCTLTNSDSAATLIVKKHVENTNGGTAVAADFTMTVSGGTPASFPGSETGTTVSVPAGTISVGETGPSGYTRSDSGCSGTIANGETKTCTVTNTAQKAHLKLVKSVVTSNGGTAVASDWTLSASGPTSLSGAGGAESDVNAGTYALSESTGPSGYTAGSWGCTAGTLTGSSLKLDPGQSATCTITNTSQTAHLKLVKNVDNTANGGTAVATDWTLTATGPTTISGAGGKESDVKAGTYALSESTGPSGYTAGSWSCDAGALTGNSLKLDPGQSATCTITNTSQTAHLKLVKNVDNTNGGTAVATDWTLTATGPTTISGAGGKESDVKAGTYALSESTGPSGYTTGLWGCSAGTLTGSSVKLDPGQSATCTITNTSQTAHLKLVKNVDNTNGGTATAAAWTLTATGPTTISGASGAESNVNAGTYALSESTGPSGYMAGSWSCDAGTLSGSSLTLGPGQSATCTITNTSQPAHLKLVKNVDNTNGGMAVAAAWTLTATGPTTISGAGGVESNVNAGTYALSESAGPSGYTAGSWSCVGGSLTGSSLTLGPGQSATCTITNTSQFASLTIMKVCAASPADAAGTGGFTVNVGTASVSVACGQSQTISTLAAGTYMVTETAKAGWLTPPFDAGALNGWTPPGQIFCDGQATNSVTLVSGVTKVCSILNIVPYCAPSFTAAQSQSQIHPASFPSSESAAPSVGLGASPAPNPSRTSPTGTRPVSPVNPGQNRERGVRR